MALLTLTSREALVLEKLLFSMDYSTIILSVQDKIDLTEIQEKLEDMRNERED